MVNGLALLVPVSGLAQGDPASSAAGVLVVASIVATVTAATRRA
jgi:hypothetical protein